MKTETQLKMQLSKKKSLSDYFIKNIWLYILVFPGLLYLIVFQYIPMYGVVIAFKDFSLVKGIMNSKWVGFANFIYLFKSETFYNVLINSLSISILKLFWGFPMPIILAILLNEVRSRFYKKTIQTIVYLPHFISWVVISGILINFLQPNGALNILLTSITGVDTNYLTSTKHFRTILIVSDIWKEVGWGTVVYFASMAGISSELYEASEVDGANRLQKIIHVTLPGITSTIVVMLILRMGSILSNGFEQIFLLYSPLVYDVADVFETYTYRIGLIDGRFSYSTAVGIFQSVVGIILIQITNRISRKYSESSLW